MYASCLLQQQSILQYSKFSAQIFQHIKLLKFLFEIFIIFFFYLRVTLIPISNSQIFISIFKRTSLLPRGLFYRVFIIRHYFQIMPPSMPHFPLTFYIPRSTTITTVLSILNRGTPFKLLRNLVSTALILLSNLLL